MSTQANQNVARWGGPRPDRAAVAPVPQSMRAAAEALEAHAERRQRLAERAKVENPARTDEEIEARMEQFGV